MLDLLDDVVDDISVFHRVDDPLSLPSPRFFRHAQRLPVRGGAVTAVLQAIDQPQEVTTTIPAAEVAEGTADDIAALAALSQNPGFPGIGYSGG